jgi:C1A family cysteine protease
MGEQPKRVFPLKIERLPSEKLLAKKVAPTPKLPMSSDLRNRCPPVYDQGELGSCTAQALACIFAVKSGRTFAPSRLFIYYNERVMLGTVMEDSGAYLSDGITSLKTTGTCSEKTWPYIISRFTTKPTQACYNEALKNMALAATNVPQEARAMKTCLAAGLPFVVGINVYESFLTPAVDATGIVPMPNKRTESLLGGHAVTCVGYNERTQMWLMRNSWGTNWGQRGYFYLPYNYLLDPTLSSDLWDISKVMNANVVTRYVRPVVKQPIINKLATRKFNMTICR